MQETKELLLGTHLFCATADEESCKTVTADYLIMPELPRSVSIWRLSASFGYFGD